MTSKYNIKAIIETIVLVLVGGLLGFGTTVIFTPEAETKIETKTETEVVNANAEVVEAEEEVPVEIEEVILETDEGELDVESVKTVDAVDAETSCPEGEECGRGAYVYAPTETPEAFYSHVIGRCWDVDGWYGSQCWDLGALFFMNYANDGRTLSTCGTGAAKGAWDCKEQNAGDEFELITDPTKLQAGDWIVFNNGQFGHVGMALGGYNNGYIALLGTNQGGLACAGGGSAANVINISLAHFAGAFRPKTYNAPEPEPEPEYSGVVYHTYAPGDFFSAVIVRLGLATEHGLWGADGDVAYYNQQLLEQGLVVDQNGRIVGNIPVGSEIKLERR